jgi:hypothetical protein
MTGSNVLIPDQIVGNNAATRQALAGSNFPRYCIIGEIVYTGSERKSFCADVAVATRNVTPVREVGIA